MHERRELHVLAMLLVGSVVSPTLGLLWLDHHRNIERLGAYIREHLWCWEPSWELYVGKNRPVAWEFIYWSAVFIFFAVSTTALGLAWPGCSGSTGLWFLWGSGALMSGIYVLAYFWTVIGRVRRRVAG
jgi:hypothetical protein